MKISIESGGEKNTAVVSEFSTIGDLRDGGLLTGSGGAAILVNGKPADNEMQLREGDTVTQLPTQGKQANVTTV